MVVILLALALVVEFCGTEVPRVLAPPTGAGYLNLSKCAHRPGVVFLPSGYRQGALSPLRVGTAPTIPYFQMFPATQLPPWEMPHEGGAPSCQAGAQAPQLDPCKNRCAQAMSG
jgi:hypothetical protein